MRAYIITTGVIFAAIALVHILRVFAEGLRLAKDPIFILLTVLAAGLAVWAWRLAAAGSPPPAAGGDHRP